MVPLEVADLKKRVGDGYTATRDKYSSTSSKNPGYNPPRPGSNRSHAPPPPAPRNQPGQSASLHPGGDGIDDHIDWANLTDEDKEIFFGWLDEFFSRYTGRPKSSFAPSGQPVAPKPVHVAPIAPSLPRRTTSDAPSITASSSVVPPPMPARNGSLQTASAPPMPPRQGSVSSSNPQDHTPSPPRRNMPPPAPAGPVRCLSDASYPCH